MIVFVGKVHLIASLLEEKLMAADSGGTHPGSKDWHNFQ
jgi:hypothetical protein